LGLVDGAGQNYKEKAGATYQPCKAHGLLTNYQQQQRLLAKNKSHKYPCNMFWEDLLSDVVVAQEAGDKVIIMVDINGHQRNDNSTKD